MTKKNKKIKKDNNKNNFLNKIQKGGSKNSFSGNFIISVLIIFFVVSAYSLINENKAKEDISISELAMAVKFGEVKEISVKSGDIEAIFQNDVIKTSKKEESLNITETLAAYGVTSEELSKIKISVNKNGGFLYWLFNLSPILFPVLFIAVFIWLMTRQIKGSGMQAFSFGQSRARLTDPDDQKQRVTFKDVAGCKEAKEELSEIVDFLKNPKKFLEIGARIPKGILLMGAPGTGKTLLARAVAGEANVSFFSISGSEFIELFVGIGASRIRSLFDQARKAGRAIIFIDEIDSIGKIRGVGITGGHEEREQTLNQLLAEMDGIGREENLIIMGATNRPEYLDPALLRPGRFDRRIVLDLPDINDREEILKIHCRGKPLALNVNLREVAERTPGFSGADLANVVNEAAILAARRGKTQVFQEEFLESIEKVLLGPERKSHILSRKEKEIAAYHESGHALVSASLPGAEPIRKISIIARGMAAGYTLKMPTEERKIKTKSEFLAEMATLLEGYCAEKIKFREITTGAANDLERASELARKLVKEYGMSSLGPISFGEREELAFLGREFETGRNYSEKVATKIDREVEKFVKNAENEARKILLKRRNLLEKIAKTLIEKETIEREEFEKLIGKKERIEKGKIIKVKIKRV